MNNFDAIKALIVQMAGNEKYITVNSTFVHFMGELEGGVFLSQLIYWADKGSRMDGWFYKKDREWEAELGIKRRGVERVTKMLKERGIVSVKVMKDHAGTPTKHYKINYEMLQKEMLQFIGNQVKPNVQNSNSEMYEKTNGNVQNGEFEMYEKTNGNVQNSISSYTEITTEITTENVDTYVDDKSPTPAPLKGKRIFADHEEPIVLAKYLHELIKKNNPYAKEPNFQAWGNDIRLMHETDGIDYTVIKNCISWCQNDSFWFKNILSAKKLREKFPTLYLQAQERKGGNAHGANRQSGGINNDSANKTYADGIDF